MLRGGSGEHGVRTRGDAVRGSWFAQHGDKGLRVNRAVGAAPLPAVASTKVPCRVNVGTFAPTRASSVGRGRNVQAARLSMPLTPTPCQAASGDVLDELLSQIGGSLKRIDDFVASAAARDADVLAQAARTAKAAGLQSRIAPASTKADGKPKTATRHRDAAAFWHPRCHAQLWSEDADAWTSADTPDDLSSSSSSGSLCDESDWDELRAACGGVFSSRERGSIPQQPTGEAAAAFHNWVNSRNAAARAPDQEHCGQPSSASSARRCNTQPQQQRPPPQQPPAPPQPKPGATARKHQDQQQQQQQFRKRCQQEGFQFGRSASRQQSSPPPVSGAAGGSCTTAAPNPRNAHEAEATAALEKARSEGPEALRRQWKALLVKWHPDKSLQGDAPEAKAAREEATRVFRHVQQERVRLGI